MKNRFLLSTGRPRHAKGWLAIALGTSVLCIFFMSSCSGRVDATIRNDASARISLRIDVPDTLAARVRQIGNIPAKAELFDIARIKAEFEGRKSISLVDVSSGSPNSLTSVLWIPDLNAFVKDSSLVPSGMITYNKVPAYGSQPAQRELALNITKDNAEAAYSLFPGMDEVLIENLNPPALDKDPVSAADYRTNLETVIIGKKAMPAFDACALEITVTLPKSASSAKGGSVNGQVFKAKIPLFDILMLEKPIQMELRWPE
ncbi:MAG: hypothetical protein LLF89_10340 [Spirochaetaceae bacterium]|nr:hypothetical protein [Spirochaetaceae bacterium]